MLTLSVHPSMRAIGEAAWDALLGPAAPPMLRFRWLDALEQTGCAVPERGWRPHHLTLHDGDRLIAAAPAYLKANSHGEFVFDFAWADASHRMGAEYYPKLVLAVPFTPATGPRLLLAPGADRAHVARAFAQGFRQLVAAGDVSGAHVLFPSLDEAAAWGDAGLATRIGIQYQWHNQGFGSFEDFLATLPSKKRTQIRRERRAIRDAGLVVETLTGELLTPRVVDAMYGFYVATVEKFEWGQQYLTRAFFEEVCATMGDAVEIVIAREGARLVAGAFNLRSDDVLYGRYWGAAEERPFLHFEVCYYHAIDEAIGRGLARFEPGAGGEHKRVRGFAPTRTASAHLLGHPRLDRAVRDYLAHERAAIERELAALDAEPPNP